jgi:hypothetical protein
MLSGEVKLGGRLFQVVNYDAVTVLNEHYIMKLMRSTGLDGVLPMANDETAGGESDQEYMLRLHAQLIDTLTLPDLLAGYLVPAGKTETDFTLEQAAEITVFIKGLTKPADKEEVHRLGLLVTFDFFAVGLASLKHSQNALRSLQASPPKNAASTLKTGAH